MWDHYKKTFVGMQSVILLITMMVLAWSHMWTVALVFFAVMQTGSALGAMWASRLKRRLEIHPRVLAMPRTQCR
jgi:low temperature requirement protein LtrA